MTALRRSGVGGVPVAAPVRRPASAPTRDVARPRRPAETRTGAARPRGPQRERHEPDWLIVVATIALAAVGILMVYSSLGLGAVLDGASTFAAIGPQVAWAGLGVAAMLVMSRVDYRWLRVVSVPGLLVAVALLIVVLLPPIGPLRPIEALGSARWLQIGPLPAMHPAEFAKLALVVYLAHWLAKRGAAVSSLTGGTIPFLLIVAPILGLVMLEPDLGTTGILTLTAFTMFFIAGASLWQLALIVPVGVAAVAYAVSRSQYQLARVQAFLDPWADPQGAGFHTVQGLLALATGGLTGIGLGGSRQPGGLHLPAAQNDFVFAVLGQELGLAGAAPVLCLYLFFAYRGVRIALSAPDTFGALLAAGITAWLTLQAFINIGVVVALVPITGITLPFVSAGGSSLVVSFAAVGILLSISRETLPRGTWNHANPHRRGRHGRAHLPGPRRRPVAADAAR